MAVAQTCAGDFVCQGVGYFTQGIQGMGRSSLDLENLAVHPISFRLLHVWDLPSSALPSAGAADDLGLLNGTLGTAPPTVQTGDVKALGATPRYARLQIALPPEYVAGEQVRIRCNAGMKTTVADVTATIDVEAYPSDGDGTMSADVCATAAQSINSLTAANKDFILTPTTLTPGMLLDVRINIAINDGATVTAVIGVLNQLELLCDRKG